MQYTFCQIQRISPHGPLAVCSVCALKKQSGVHTQHWLCKRKANKEWPSPSHQPVLISSSAAVEVGRMNTFSSDVTAMVCIITLMKLNTSIALRKCTLVTSEGLF